MDLGYLFGTKSLVIHWFAIKTIARTSEGREKGLHGNSFSQGLSKPLGEEDLREV
jgi:hypothetical protein